MVPWEVLDTKSAKKKSKKGSINGKRIMKIENSGGFFNFFSPPQVPDNDEESD